VGGRPDAEIAAHDPSIVRARRSVAASGHVVCGCGNTDCGRSSAAAIAAWFSRNQEGRPK
jgi:hypothetical protein